MASLLYTVWSITNVASMHCAARPEISPCTCELVNVNDVQLTCEKVESFHQIVDALKGRFQPNLTISLTIAHSQLDDLEMRSFSEMNLTVKKLKLQYNNLRSIPERPFRGLASVVVLSFSDNELDEIPKHALFHFPNVSTLDFAKSKINYIGQDDLKKVQELKHLILVNNNISRIDHGAFPKKLRQIHLAHNRINSLNGTLKDLEFLESLFVNNNNISSLEEELPCSPYLRFILAQNNELEKLPVQLKTYPNMVSLYLQNNKIKSLDGIVKNMTKLIFFKISNNQIRIINSDEFSQAYKLEDMDMSNNIIESTNGSLSALMELRSANLSFNNIKAFNLDEIKGLRFLKSLDLSHNEIELLYQSDVTEIHDKFHFTFEFHLEYNNLKTLNNAFKGINSLRSIILTHNKLESLSSEDFNGLPNLEMLDVSYNGIMTLEQLAMTFLPNMKTLRASDNNITSLDKDFHNMPTLCHAHLNNNQITSVSYDLVSNTQCTNLGVVGKLEVWLENNPIMCDSNTYTELCSQLARRNSRLRGKSQCYENDMEVCLDDPIDIISVENSNSYKIHHIPIMKPGGTATSTKQRIATLTPTPQTAFKPQIMATIQTLYAQAQVSSSSVTTENTTLWEPELVTQQTPFAEPTIITVQDPSMSKRNTNEDNNEIKMDSL